MDTIITAPDSVEEIHKMLAIGELQLGDTVYVDDDQVDEARKAFPHLNIYGMEDYREAASLLEDMI